MAIGNMIVGIDIGTSKVSLVVSEVNKFNQVEIICTTSSPCDGIKKGKISSIDEVALSIKKAIMEAQELANIRIDSAYINLQGKYVTIVQNSIFKEVKDKYSGVSSRDVFSSIAQVKDINIPDDKILIDVVTDKFVLDTGKEVDDPIGILCSSFTLKSQIILADREYVKELTLAVKKSGISIDGIVPNVLAQRNFISDINELNDNVMILDIGAGNTDIGVFEGSSFIYANTIPLGGDNITNDIALVLQISEQEAEKLKKQYGLALKSFIDNDNDIVLNTFKEENKVIKSSELIEIIEARIEEIFSLVGKDIQVQNLKSKINNVILTGQGITNINKSDVAGKIILNIPVKISTARLISTIKPDYSAAYALVKYIAFRPFVKTSSNGTTQKSSKNVFNQIMERIKEFFYS